MRNHSPRPGARRGSALIEGALVLSALLLLILALIDVGNYLYVNQSLTERARAAVRWGAVAFPTRGFDEAAIVNMVFYGQPTPPPPPTVSGGAAPEPAFHLDRSMVAVKHLGAGTPGERIVLTIARHPHMFVSPVFSGVLYSPTVTAAAAVEASGVNAR